MGYGIALVGAYNYVVSIGYSGGGRLWPQGEANSTPLGVLMLLSCGRPFRRRETQRGRRLRLLPPLGSPIPNVTPMLTLPIRVKTFLW